jgi:hypothetical protein
MDPLETFDRQYEEAAQLYRAIGRFIVQFEWLCNAMRSQICELVWEDPTTPSTPIDIVLGDVQASGLLLRLRALLAREPGFSESDRPITEDVCGRIEELTRLRNTVVHGLWFMEFPLPDGTRVNARLRYRRSGPHTAGWKRTPEEIDLLADEAEALSHLLGQMRWALNEGIEMSEYAVWDGDGHVKVLW